MHTLPFEKIDFLFAVNYNREEQMAKISFSNRTSNSCCLSLFDKSKATDKNKNKLNEMTSTKIKCQVTLFPIAFAVSSRIISQY